MIKIKKDALLPIVVVDELCKIAVEFVSPHCFRIESCEVLHDFFNNPELTY
jgi:hypothetical protein